jgi:glucosamine 6-phosphate synthetase-like amidotransferase/phosphosugar isomerase protein
VFQRLLLLNQKRGHHAAGIATVDGSCGYQLLKRPMEAVRFTRLPEFRDFMNLLKPNTTLLMGHTRFATVGDIEKAENAHPIRSGSCLGTVNGTIFNADALFRKFRLTRFAEVDSELIVRLANKCASEGRIQIGTFLNYLKHCRGQLAAVLTSYIAPEEVMVLKGNRPLSLFYNPMINAIIYSSETTHIMTVLRGDKNWLKLNLAPMTCIVFNVDNLITPKAYPLKFIPQGRRKKL